MDDFISNAIRSGFHGNDEMFQWIFPVDPAASLSCHPPGESEETRRRRRPVAMNVRPGIHSFAEDPK
jgi:hypothetical protein